MLLGCCDAIADALRSGRDEFLDMEAAASLDIANILTELITLSDVEEGKENEFERQQRAAFDEQ